MSTGDQEQPIHPLPLTTRELLAAILLYSEQDTFEEDDLVDQVAHLRHRSPGHDKFTECVVYDRLQMLVLEQVLRYAGASDRFFFDRRNAGYLRNILASSHAFPDLEGWLGRMVAMTAPKNLRRCHGIS